jgi:serine/threonine protein kinase
MSDNQGTYVGQIFGGRYHLIEKLGEGGMGEVYKATDTNLNINVAVKTLRLELAANPTFKARFQKEAAAAAKVRHQNNVLIYLYGLQQEHLPPFIAMECLHGETLRDVIEREGVFEVNRAVRLICEICAGVGKAHREGILHRDLKPENVMIISSNDDDEEEEKIKVVDFGLARLPDSKFTNTGQFIGGTVSHMPPEQWRGLKLDARADVYSLGVILYEMLAGSLPFQSETFEGWMRCHLDETAPPLPPDLPREISDVVMKSLDKDREVRPESANALKTELKSALKAANLRITVPSPPPVPVPFPAPAPPFKPSKPKKWLVVTAGILVLVLGAFLIAALIIYVNFPRWQPPVNTANENSNTSPANVINNAANNAANVNLAAATPVNSPANAVVAPSTNKGTGNSTNPDAGGGLGSSNPNANLNVNQNPGNSGNPYTRRTPVNINVSKPPFNSNKGNTKPVINP